MKVALDVLEHAIPGLQVDYADGLEPFQMEGNINGYPFYYRERGENVQLNLSVLGDEPLGDTVYWSSSTSWGELPSTVKTTAHAFAYLVSVLEPARVWFQVGVVDGNPVGAIATTFEEAVTMVKATVPDVTVLGKDNRRFVPRAVPVDVQVNLLTLPGFSRPLKTVR